MGLLVLLVLRCWVMFLWWFGVNLYSDGLCTCVCLLFWRCLICFGLVVVARLSVWVFWLVGIVV